MSRWSLFSRISKDRCGGCVADTQQSAFLARLLGRFLLHRRCNCCPLLLCKILRSLSFADGRTRQMAKLGYFGDVARCFGVSAESRKSTPGACEQGRLSLSPFLLATLLLLRSQSISHSWSPSLEFAIGTEPGMTLYSESRTNACPGPTAPDPTPCRFTPHRHVAARRRLKLWAHRS